LLISNQILFSTVVLGLSITLAKGQHHGAVPATTGYAGFAGAFGILAGLVGVAALFVNILNGIISWAFDALAALVLLAGGIAYAIGLKDTSCSNYPKMVLNPLLNCGSTGKPYTDSYKIYCDATDEKSLARAVQGRCKEATADDVFLFLACVTSIAVLAISFLQGRNKAGGSYIM
jgi:hypothetical protein